MSTTDREYADLLARLNAIPAQQPERRTGDTRLASMAIAVIAKAGGAT